MSKIAIVYGTSTGVTKDIASKIKSQIGESDVFDVADLKSGEVLQPYDFLILGASTTGYGDLQDDWDSFLPQLSKTDLSGKKIALFGLGDSSSYSDTFVNSLRPLYDAVSDKAEVVGAVSTEGYTFDDSEAVIDGHFVGLAIDDDNESDLTDERIANWVEGLKKYFS